MKSTLYLISNSPRDRWLRGVKSALTSIGNLDDSNESIALNQIAQKNYDLIVVHANNPNKVSSILNKVFAKKPNARVVVTTASNSWRLARAAFLNGAMDYVSDSLAGDDIVPAFKSILQKHKKKKIINLALEG